MKPLACGLAALVCLPLTASAMVRLGESSELFFTGSPGVRVDDNIFLSDLDEVDDTILELSPGLKLVFGQGAKTSGSLDVTGTLTRYLDNNALDDELLSSAFAAGYDDAKLKLDLKLSYRELNQSTRDVRGTTLVRRDALGASLDSRVNVSEKTSAGLGLSYGETDYKQSGYIDIEETALPLNYFYSIAEKVDLSVGLRYRETSLGIPAGDSTDYYYNIGARGDFTPKFSGTFSIGYNQRQPEIGGDETALGTEAALSYLLSEKTTLSLALSNDFSTSAEGISQKNLTVTPTFTTRFTAAWEGSAGATYQKIEYFSGRTDEYVDARLSTSYIINENATVSLGCNIRSNDSDVSFLDASGRRRSADFDNSVITLSALVRY
jgi:polysaccharide biosynthesis protein VpsM